MSEIELESDAETSVKFGSALVQRKYSYSHVE